MIKILIADDHRLVREGVIRILAEDQELQVVGEAANGQEAIEMIEEHKPDINICGHIHEAQSIDKIGETIVMNPGQIMTGGACLIQIDDENSQIDSKIIKL